MGKKLTSIEWYPLEKAKKLYPKFPHFKPYEATIMKAFLEREILKGLYAFDVRLDVDVPMPEGVLPHEHATYLVLKAKRIDALCLTATALWILEVKDRTRPSLLGELLTYKQMLLDQYEVDRPVKLGAVVGVSIPSDEQVLKSYGVEVFNMNLPYPPKRIAIWLGR